MEPNKMTGKFTVRFIPGWVSILAWAASAAAQTVVVGTGNPNIDVPAVQAAVNQGGEVVLRGHFSFDRPPTIVLPPSLQSSPAMVLVSKAVSISGAPDGEMTSIEGGTLPFYVEAPGAAVTIEGLHFVRPKGGAVLVYAVSGLVIASCKIEGSGIIEGFSAGIVINTGGTPGSPGKAENVSGTILIVNNDIDMAGGTASDTTLGVIIFYVGAPGAEVEAYLSGNRIRNFTERAIDIRGIGGRTFIEGNGIATGTIAGSLVGALQALFVAGDTKVTASNSYLIAHNSVDVQWPIGSAAGISVRAPASHAIVVDNDVNMEAPEGTVFDFGSAGIQIVGGQGDVVLGNRIQGHARAALSVGTAGASANNAFVLNHLDDFKASLADIYVDGGIMNTLIVGQGTVEDHGIGTVIVPVADGGEGKDKNDHQQAGAQSAKPPF
jgi:hypothetical protein